MNTATQTAILRVRLSAPAPANSSTIETKSGAVRWALLDDTLLLQPEQEAIIADTAHMEHLIRTVMRRSGLAKRYHVFAVASDCVQGQIQTGDR